MALLDETGGKPLTGYGSGANSGAPVATPAEQAAALEAQASALQDDFNAMCKNGGGYAFAGEFCSAVVDEAVSLRYQATVLTHQGSPRNIVAPMAAVLWVGDRGAEFAKGTKKSASLLGRGLRQGSSVGGKYLPTAGRAAKKLAPVAKTSSQERAAPEAPTKTATVSTEKAAAAAVVAQPASGDAAPAALKHPHIRVTHTRASAADAVVVPVAGVAGNGSSVSGVSASAAKARSSDCDEGIAALGLCNSKGKVGGNK
jgi:hypothetical protein